MNSEENFVKAIDSVISAKKSYIGDDCAVLPLSGTKKMLVTSDMLIEDVDFDFKYCTFEAIGFKSAMVNLSDIAAMGGTPQYMTYSIGMPQNIKISDIKKFYNGVKKATKKNNVQIVGGDLSSSEKFVISVSVIGHANSNNIKMRSGANIGDQIFFIGKLGWSSAGLEILRNKSQHKKTRDFKSFTKEHLTPNAHVDAGKILGTFKEVSSMIDISDGLSTDLSRICKASNCGAVIYEDKLPIDSKLKSIAEKLKKDALSFVLHGGEDYSLLFTCKAKESLTNKFSNYNLKPVHIGEIVSSKKGLSILNSNGKLNKLKISGYDHFIHKT